MRTLVIYYSRTGTTATLAHALASELDADTREIRCARYHGALLGYILAGYDSLSRQLPKVEVPDFAVDDYDTLLIGTPVWTSYPSAPITAFLAGKPDLPARVGLFMTYGGHSPAQKTIDCMSELLPVPIRASLALKSEDVGRETATDAVSQFAHRLRQSIAHWTV